MKKKAIPFILLALIVIGFSYLYVRLPIINGYAAKNMCSCVFIDGRKPDFVQKNDLNFSFLKYTQHHIDTAQHFVESSFWGLRPKRAYYNSKLGCALIHSTKNIEQFKNFNFDKKGIKYTENSDLKIELSDNNELLQQALDNHFANKKINTKAVLVVHKNKLIAEQYAQGYTTETRFLGWSMAKSITSTLVGILVKEGKINIHKTIDEPLWKNDGRREITWHHVLQMSTGIAWEEDYGSISDVTKMLYTEDDVYKTAIQNKLEFPVGTVFEYSSGSSNILAGQIRKILGNDELYWQYPYRQLFAKLGAKSMLLESDAKGTFVGSSYPWGTARDWAKYGLLYLQNGKWNNEQIITKEWVKYTQTPASNSNGKYGAQFWLHTAEEFPDVPSDMYFADGFQGQRVFIIPSKELVIVRFGLSSNGKVDFNQFIKEVIESLEE